MTTLGVGGTIGGGAVGRGTAAVLAAILGSLYSKIGLPFTFFIGLATAALLGLTNGIIITKGKFSPIIVTLAMMGIIRGLAFSITGAEPVHIYRGVEEFRFVGTGRIGFLPMPVIIWIGAALYCHWLLVNRRLGRHIYAVGGNLEATRLSGINVDRTRIAAYTLCGLLTGMGAIISVARIGVAQATDGSGFEFDSIAAVIVGGANLFGGEGSAIRTVVGMVILGTIINLMNLLNVSVYAQPVVKGMIIIAAVLTRELKKL
jgi:ribose transport system permease protein